MSCQPMRVLFLADAVAEDLPGGSRTAARELARGLTCRGHEVTFLVGHQTADAPEEEVKEGVRIRRYAGAGRAMEFLRSGKEACERLLSRQPFDLVHSHFAYAGVGPLCAVPKHVPRLRTFHGPWDEEGWIEDTQQAGAINSLKARVKRRMRGEIEGCSLRGSAKVLTLSRCFRDLAIRRYAVEEARSEVVPGGTDTEMFRPLPAHCLRQGKAGLRRELGLPLEKIILLSVRRLVPRMGLSSLIRAMPEILAHCPAAFLVIGGKGPEEARLRQLIEDLRLGANVQLAGFIAPEQLVSYYRAADLFVLPTLALEGFGLVTTEALSCGLPVVGTPVGATPEILRPLDPRLIARGTEPHGLAEAVVGYLNGDWREGLTPQHLHDYVARNFTWDRHTARTEQIYRDAVAGSTTEK